MKAKIIHRTLHMFRLFSKSTKVCGRKGQREEEPSGKKQAPGRTTTLDIDFAQTKRISAGMRDRAQLSGSLINSRVMAQ